MHEAPHQSTINTKIANPSSREKLVMTSQYECPSFSWREGEGHLNVARDFGCSQ